MASFIWGISSLLHFHPSDVTHILASLLHASECNFPDPKEGTCITRQDLTVVLQMSSHGLVPAVNKVNFCTICRYLFCVFKNISYLVRGLCYGGDGLSVFFHPLITWPVDH